MDRTYIFGEKHKIIVPNGGFLTPEKIKHYEFCFGKLQFMSYMGRITLNI